MIWKPRIDLKEAFKLSQAAEKRHHAKQLAGRTDRLLHEINRHKKKNRKQSIAAAPTSDVDERQDKTNQSRAIRHCKFYSGNHPRGSCLACGQKSHKCHRKNHVLNVVLTKVLPKLRRKVIMNMLNPHLMRSFSLTL